MQTIDNERGAVLVVGLIVLGLLIVIGTAVAMTASIELGIARNEKVAQGAFYRAENARILSARIVRSVFSGSSYTDGTEYEAGSNVFVMDGDFAHEAIGDSDVHSDATVDVQMTDSSAASIANVDVDKVSVGHLPGGSAEFGSGYEGTGKAASAQVQYVIHSEGRAASHARSLVDVEYRMIP